MGLLDRVVALVKAPPRVKIPSVPEARGILETVRRVVIPLPGDDKQLWEQLSLRNLVQSDFEVGAITDEQAMRNDIRQLGDWITGLQQQLRWLERHVDIPAADAAQQLSVSEGIDALQTPLAQLETLATVDDVVRRQVPQQITGRVVPLRERIGRVGSRVGQVARNLSSVARAVGATQTKLREVNARTWDNRTLARRGLQAGRQARVEVRQEATMRVRVDQQLAQRIQAERVQRARVDRGLREDLGRVAQVQQVIVQTAIPQLQANLAEEAAVRRAGDAQLQGQIAQVARVQQTLTVPQARAVQRCRPQLDRLCGKDPRRLDRFLDVAPDPLGLVLMALAAPAIAEVGSPAGLVDDVLGPVLEGAVESLGDVFDDVLGG